MPNMPNAGCVRVLNQLDVIAPAVVRPEVIQPFVNVLLTILRLCTGQQRIVDSAFCDVRVPLASLGGGVHKTPVSLSQTATVLTVSTARASGIHHASGINSSRLVITD